MVITSLLPVSPTNCELLEDGHILLLQHFLFHIKSLTYSDMQEALDLYWLRGCMLAKRPRSRLVYLSISVR